MDQEILNAWPVYRLICEGKLSLDRVDSVSIDDVDRVCMALDAHDAAMGRLAKRK